MKLILDENLSRKHADRLRALGHDVVAIAEIGLAGSNDFTVRSYAIADDRVVVTLDADFGNIRPLPGVGNARRDLAASASAD